MIETLIHIIERECANGSVIHSDEWPAYSNLNAMGYQHSTVNHQRHYGSSDRSTHSEEDSDLGAPFASFYMLDLT